MRLFARLAPFAALWLVTGPCRTALALPIRRPAASAATAIRGRTGVGLGGAMPLRRRMPGWSFDQVGAGRCAGTGCLRLDSR